ncbi:MAG: UDP-N-acetylmuramate dehydrogenase [Burkholderiales bacterium]|nr:UDP-N-acetylmuramate dehydrogenase [Burkholderiales bacterium]
MSDATRLAHPALRGELRHDEPMARHVTWRAGGRARTFFHPADLDDLAAFLAGLPGGEPVLFLGLGPSGGAEWMAGVPGTVGGALAMNAGCYGGETWNHVVSVRTIDRRGTLRTRTATDYEIGYRHVASRHGAEEWFVGATFAFDAGNEAAAMAAMKALLVKRVASQPLDLPNAGSVFRNPPGDHAARLVESCGLKGFAVGSAQVSTKHANFIVNLGGASAADIEAVIAHVQATVKARTGVELVREVRIVGSAGGASGSTTP